MNKEELIAELQKIEGNPVIGIGLNKAWGKYTLGISGITPLYNHDGHKVEGVSILEINAEDAQPITEEQLRVRKQISLSKKYGPLVNCSINERFWAVNGPWLDKWNQEKIARLEEKIKNLESKQGFTKTL
jgi:hypothetical protein